MLLITCARVAGCTEAARIFDVSCMTIHRWLCREDLTPRPSKERRRKLDKAALAVHVLEHPEALLRERAEAFGVSINAIWVALKKLKIIKKNDEVR